MEHLERGPAVGHDHQFPADLGGCCVEEAVGVGVLDHGVREQQDEVIGAVALSHAGRGEPRANAAAEHHDVLRLDRQAGSSLAPIVLPWFSDGGVGGNLTSFTAARQAVSLSRLAECRAMR